MDLKSTSMNRPDVATMNKLFTIITVVCLLATSADGLFVFSIALLSTLLIVGTLVTGTHIIARRSAQTKRRSLAWTAGLSVAGASLLAAPYLKHWQTVAWDLRSDRAGLIVLLWTAGAWLARSSNPVLVPDLDETAAPPKRPRFTMTVVAITVFVLSLAFLKASLACDDLDAALAYMLAGRGIYHVLIGFGALMTCATGVKLERRGLAPVEAPATNMARDHRTIERWGGRMSAVGGLGLGLVCLQAAQSAYEVHLKTATPNSGSSSPPSSTIGLFELLTWLGTLGTLVVVAGALVAMYVKRRDDDSQHGAAVTGMRQDWIDRSRLLLSDLLALGETMRTRMDAHDFDPQLSQEALKRLRERCTPNMPARKVTRSIHEGARDLARDIATTDA